jgi:hypothetical protein
MLKDPRELLNRALNYFYKKEIKSSLGIEHIKPTATRTERFVTLLQTAETDEFFSKHALVALQNQIVDERFQNRDYRADQNDVGESVSWQNERVHLVSPKPKDIQELMNGMAACHGRMSRFKVAVNLVIHAAAVAHAFVFMLRSRTETVESAGF